MSEKDLEVIRLARRMELCDQARQKMLIEHPEFFKKDYSVCYQKEDTHVSKQ